MANPFLVLGGIAISVATAAFGILQVPGWVASAQDAAALNDLTQVTAAQAASVSETGLYAGSLLGLAQSSSVKVTVGDVATAASVDRKHTVAVALSGSGRYFARLGSSSRIGEGASPEAAVTAAGTTVTDGVTAEGVRVPGAIVRGSELARNIYENPYLSSPHATGRGTEIDLQLITDFPGDVSTGIRSTRLDHHNVRYLDLITGTDTPFGKDIRFTARIRVDRPVDVDFSLRHRVYEPALLAAPDKKLTLQPGVNEIDLTFQNTEPLEPNELSGITIRSEGGAVGALAGSWIEVTRVSISDAADGIGFFTGDSGTIAGATASWVGERGRSQSIYAR